MLKKINKKIINKVQDFVDKHTHAELIENEKMLLRKLLREMKNFDEISSYSIDYSEEDFRVSLVKENCQEHILYNKEVGCEKCRCNS